MVSARLVRSGCAGSGGQGLGFVDPELSPPFPGGFVPAAQLPTGVVLSPLAPVNLLLRLPPDISLSLAQAVRRAVESLVSDRLFGVSPASALSPSLPFPKALDRPLQGTGQLVGLRDAAQMRLTGQDPGALWSEDCVLHGEPGSGPGDVPVQ